MKMDWNSVADADPAILGAIARGIGRMGRSALLSGVLAFLTCVRGFAVTCPAGSTQLISTTAGGNASSAMTWGGKSILNKGDGYCLVIDGPVVDDLATLGTSGKKGVAIFVSPAGSLSLSSGITHAFYFRGSGADPCGSGSTSSPGADATMWGIFAQGNISIEGTQTFPVTMSSAKGVSPFYIAKTEAPGNPSITVKWAQLTNLGAGAECGGIYPEFSGIGFYESWNPSAETVDIENNVFINPYAAFWGAGASPQSQISLIAKNNVITGRRGGSTFSNEYHLLSADVENNTESAPGAAGYFAVFNGVQNSFTWTGNVIAGTEAYSAGGLTGIDFPPNTTLGPTLVYNDPEMAGASSPTSNGLDLQQSTGTNAAYLYCENCNQSFALRYLANTDTATLTNSVAITNHRAWAGQGAYFVSGGLLNLQNSICIFTDETVTGAEGCVFAYGGNGSAVTSIQAKNNTLYRIVGGRTESFGFGIDESPYTMTNNLLENNLVGGFGSDIGDGTSGRDVFVNSCGGVGVCRNATFGVGTSYATTAEPANWDNGTVRHPSVLYGDVNGIDPLFLNPTRTSLAAYDAQVLSGPGTMADFFAQLGKRAGWGGTYPLSSTPIQDVVQWVQYGFTPTNASICPGGVTIGAVPCAGVPLTLSPGALPNGTPNVKYAQTLTVGGGVNCMFITAGVLPPGLALSYTGTSNSASLSGVPTAAGAYSFLLVASCENGVISQSLAIQVNAIPRQTDVTGQIGVVGSGLTFNRTTNIYKGTITITNTGSTFLSAPLQAVFTALTFEAAMIGPTGAVPVSNSLYPGVPYITVSSIDGLAPGASLTFPVQFLNPFHVAVGYILRVLSGGF
ncbi:MAG TPA: hypothetical protein VGL82_03640 [Bryobacteraceae bacterium]|jgi:hypothetical protein